MDGQGFTILLGLAVGLALVLAGRARDD